MTTAEEYETPEIIPARMVNEFVYCPRLFHLEWAQGRFVSNDDVREGLHIHRGVDKPASRSVDLDDSGFLAGRQSRSVWLSSHRLGLSAKIDIVDRDEAGAVVPVEYKKGSPDGQGNPWPSDRIQSLVQAVLLRDAGYPTDHAEIWYATVKRKVALPIGDDAEAEVVALLARMRDTAAQVTAPPPLVDSPKCPRCSLVSVCLPDEMNALQQRLPARPRRLIATDRDEAPLYVSVQGASIGISRSRVEVKKDRELLASSRIIDVSQICIFGNVSISSFAMRELLARQVPVSWFSYGGWFAGMATGMPSGHVDLRRAQVFAALDHRGLDAAKQIVKAKIRNSRTLLRRNGKPPPERAIAQLMELQKPVASIDSQASLLGLEGAAARIYFGTFTAMIGENCAVDVSAFDVNGRNRRPPRDPLNALLSFLYSMLCKDMAVCCHLVGADPAIGIYHHARRGRPALALDLAEEFRPLIAESVAIQVLNNAEIKDSDFVISPSGVNLTADGRRAVLRAYERRLRHEIKHPTFGYRVSYRRALELQVRIMAGYLVGELPSYTPLVTR